MLTWLLFEVLPPRWLHALGLRVYREGWADFFHDLLCPCGEESDED